MTRVVSHSPSEHIPRILLDPDAVRELLIRDAAIQWPAGTGPDAVRVERAWPSRHGGFSYEWSFQLGSAPRVALFGSTCPTTTIKSDSSSYLASVGSSGLQNIIVRVPKWDLLIHSLDRDPCLSQIRTCVDGDAMAEKLTPVWSALGTGNGSFPAAVECTVLGYRAGRRAAFRYQSTNGRRPSDGLVGKIYHDERAADVLHLHARLNEGLARISDGSVRAASPVALLPELQMAVFSWVPNRSSNGTPISPADQAAAAIDALACLHRVSLDGLPHHTAEDENGINARWHDALIQIDQHHGDRLGPLLTRLQSAAEKLKSGRLCTLHRDFYESQFVRTRRTITLLDLDTVALGEPALDVGNLLAHLYLSSLRGGLSAADTVSLLQAVVRRYVDCMGPLSDSTLAFYWASASFRIAAVHALRTQTRRFAPLLWEVSRLLMGEAGSDLTSDECVVGHPADRLDPRTVLEV